jgi:hypothetical protein
LKLTPAVLELASCNSRVPLNSTGEDTVALAASNLPPLPEGTLPPLRIMMPSTNAPKGATENCEEMPLPVVSVSLEVASTLRSWLVESPSFTVSVLPAATGLDRIRSLVLRTLSELMEMLAASKLTVPVKPVKMAFCSDVGAPAPPAPPAHE